MKISEINAIVTMEEKDYQKLLKTLKVEAEQAYANYCGTTPRPQPGTPQAAGHGSTIGGFQGQEAWLAAKKHLENVKLCRTPAQTSGS